MTWIVGLGLALIIFFGGRWGWRALKAWALRLDRRLLEATLDGRE